MGLRTNIIVIVDGSEKERETAIGLINDWMDKNDEPWLEINLNPKGGEGGFCCSLLNGRYNYFDIGDFITALQSVAASIDTPTGQFVIQLLYNTQAYFYTSVAICPTLEEIEHERGEASQGKDQQ